MFLAYLAVVPNELCSFSPTMGGLCASFLLRVQARPASVLATLGERDVVPPPLSTVQMGAGRSLAGCWGHIGGEHHELLAAAWGVRPEVVGCVRAAEQKVTVACWSHVHSRNIHS